MDKRRNPFRTSIRKGIALLLVLSLLSNLFMPTVAMALTGGPSQPEFQGFTEIGVNNMVDPFTGDFNYEIPLMTVPGPNGGYPINLTYSGGVGMEDEASWVGLGWNLNPGAINRNMRGVPDDFSGPQEDDGTEIVGVAEADHITKSYFTKNNVTVGIGFGLNLELPEVVGADLSFASVSPNINIYYNTYKGMGVRAGVGMKLSTLNQEGSSGGLSAGLNLNFDSNDGASAQPSLSFTAKGNKMATSVSVGFGYNSRQGITNTFLNTSISKSVPTYKVSPSSRSITGLKITKHSDSQSAGNGISFAATSGVPSTSMAMAGFNTGFNLDFEGGALQTTFDIPVSFNGMLSVQKVKDWMADGYAYPAYGTLYSGYRENEAIAHGRALMDYNREKDFAVNLQSPMLPMPAMTHDVYTVTGAGIGGSFRAFRNDVGVFYEPRVASDFLGITLGMEVAASTGFKLGVDPTVNFSHSYSGKWKVAEDIEQVTGTNYFRKSSHLVKDGVRTVQPFDFRFTGENTALSSGENRFSTLGGNGSANFTLFPASADFPSLSDIEFEDPDAMEQMNKFFPFKDLGKFKPKASNKMNGKAIMPEHTVRKYNERKIQLVEYRTKGEIQLPGVMTHLPKIFVNNPNDILPSPSDKTDFDLNQSAIKRHHISEFTIVQPGGMRYVYGLPLYNRVHEEYYFAVPKHSDPDARTITVSNVDVLLTQTRKGKAGDKAFTSSKISPYVHSHLITQITSPDYVDATGDGPSDDDFGYWTKFNYQTPQTYKWRVPLKRDEANYIKGLPSNPNDDKATVNYGERDMTYLHSVETKTHVAVFYLEDRNDARDVNGLRGGIAASGKMKRLDKIVLYSKNDLGTPLKSVHFEYTYDLCLNAPNASTGKGKLTLKKVYFQYGNSTKGSLSPYVFDYGQVYQDNYDGTELVENTGLEGNPDYLTMEVDRWGTYKESTGGLSNDDYPYVDQTDNTAADQRRKESATAWNLTSITLPTGALIKISYELDDYAYVQDKPATQMYRIAGMGNGSLKQMLGNGADASITDNFLRVYFHLDNGNTQASDIKKMIDQTPDGKMYFKTWQRLQIPKGFSSSQWAYDYVTGYAPISKTQYGIEEIDNVNYGYVTLLPQTGGPSQNFFRTAGLQYLRYQRADLDMPQNQADASLEAAAMILTCIPVITQAMEMIKGYYNWALGRNYCQQIGNGEPSYIKLGIADGVKYGGGYRVNKITVSDAWREISGETSATYGMEYFYTTKDAAGTTISSGVASYEPLLGGDENPLRKAHYYSTDSKFAHNDPAFFLEEPFGESYFPAPVVGYSKVTIANLANKKVTKTGDAIQEKEFFTAKDFPIKTSFTIQPQRIEDKQSVFIPLIANISLKGYGYSQGYYIELNDMHGKAKTESSYDADYWDASANEWKIENPPFVTKKIFTYKSSGNSLTNTVDVLDGDEMIRTAVMGESSEMFSEMKEDFGYSIGAGAQINGGIDPLPMGIFFSGFPNFEYSENSARSLVTTKVVYKNGILDQVLEMNEGAVKKTRNLLYDAENGSPLLTVVTSDYDDSQTAQNDQYIYNYMYPAHWNYSGMQAAYRNYRNYYDINTNGTFLNAGNYFEVGDELLSSTGDRVWVSYVGGSTIAFVDLAGNNVSTVGKFVTVKSGKRNLQNTPSGSLVSLQNPIGAQYNVLTNFFNEEVYGNPAYNYNLTGTQSITVPFPQEGIRDCANPDLVFFGKLLITRNPNNQISNTEPIITFLFPSEDDSLDTACAAGFVIPAQLLNTPYGFNPSKMELGRHSSTHLLLSYHHSSTQILRYPVLIDGKCRGRFNFCMDGVLNASADEFSDDWQYNGEFGALAALNDYLKGRRGIWRKLRTNAFFAERKHRNNKITDNVQTLANTYIGRDGTYERFCVFDWKYYSPAGGQVGNKDNAQAPLGWRWQAEVTPYGYSPYGYEIENRNAMNIFSAELYGYNNSVVTASTQNAAYPEIAFDGFEESPAGTYVPHGHIRFGTGDMGTPPVVSITNEHSHTGNQSLKLVTNEGWIYLNVPLIYPPSGTFSRGPSGDFEMNAHRRYVISFWFRYENLGPTFEVLIKDPEAPAGYNFVQTFHIPYQNQNTIEGWQRVEVIVDIADHLANDTHVPVDPTYLFFDFLPGNNRTVYIDDLRIYPVDAPFKSYVYSPRNYLLRAVLDDNNYATFYNYDEENTLIQVKKETVRGIQTIQTTRKNVKQPTN